MSVLWPQSLLSTDVPNARIMTFGYDADVTKLDSSQVTNGTMESHAADLCVALARRRADTDSVRDQGRLSREPSDSTLRSNVRLY